MKETNAISATLLQEIQGGSADIEVDSYEDFARIYPPAILVNIFHQVQGVVEQEGLEPNDVLVAGFTYDPDNPSTGDEFKLKERSNVGNTIADTNTAQLVHRDIAVVRASIERLAHELLDLDSQSILTTRLQRDKSDQIAAHRANSARLQKQLQQPSIPLYFFTKLAGILDHDPEYNPLGYAGFDGLKPGRSGIALFDSRAMREAGFQIKQKGDQQLMVAITGDRLRSFMKAQLFLNVKPLTPS